MLNEPASLAWPLLAFSWPFGLVFDDADIDEAVAGALQSKFRNSGQTCICANRLFVHEKVYDTFLEKFTNNVKKILN